MKFSCAHDLSSVIIHVEDISLHAYVRNSLQTSIGKALATIQTIRCTLQQKHKESAFFARYEYPYTQIYSIHLYQHRENSFSHPFLSSSISVWFPLSCVILTFTLFFLVRLVVSRFSAVSLFMLH